MKNIVLNLYVQLICQMLEDRRKWQNISLIVRKNYMQKGKKKLCTNETCHKKKFCLIKQHGTSQWILQKKKSFYLTELSGINHWILKKKKSFCSNQQSGRNHLVLQKNNLLSSRAIW